MELNKLNERNRIKIKPELRRKGRATSCELCMCVHCARLSLSCHGCNVYINKLCVYSFLNREALDAEDEALEAVNQ